MDTESIQPDLIKQKITENLGIRDLTPYSVISNLVDGFVSEGAAFVNYAEDVLDNMYVETCSNEFLEKAGHQEGLYRTKVPTLRFYKDTGIVSLANIGGGFSGNKINKGTTYTLDEKLSVRFIEDTDLITGSNEYYNVSVDLIFNPNVLTISYIKGETFALDGNYYLKINSDINVPVSQEDLETFRNRILYSKTISKFGSESAVRLSLASSPLVTDYVITYNDDIPIVWLYNNRLLIDADMDYILDTTAIPVIESDLNNRKAFGMEYELKVPNKVNIRIELTKKDSINNSISLPSSIFSFVDSIATIYKVGSRLTINTDLLKTHLLNNNIDPDILDNYNIKFVKSFETYHYSPPDNTIHITEEEYPFITSIMEL